MNIQNTVKEIMQKIKQMPETHLFAYGAIALGIVLILIAVILML